VAASYDPVAALYDQHWGYEFSELAKAAFDTRLLPVLREGSAVLDLCCGTGLILAHLEHLGFRTAGVDESSKMLAIARNSAPNATLHHADMAAFSLDVRFHAIVSFYNSLNHARSLKHLRATLMNVAKHLAAGGLLLFDYVLPEGFETAWEWCEQIDAGDDVWTFRYTFEKSTGHATCLINQHNRIRQTAFQPFQIRDALADAGLEVVLDALMPEAHPRNARRLLLASATFPRSYE
jgi:SAM-dependent methyltransferase